jgi:dolichol-phosphate mannosyltransferase
LKLLIAVPTYNEARHVQRVVEEILPHARDILIIDDASTDQTPEILKSLPVRVLRHEKNLGYGAALIDAFGYADKNGFDWVITMDADGQHEADSIPTFIEEIKTDMWDLISGSRYLAARCDDDLPPLQRRGVNFRITRVVNDLFGLEITDSFCGFKAHRTSAMKRLALTETGYAFPLQLWPRVWEARLRVREIPVRRIYNDPNRSFGAHLDDVDRRMKHYIDVLNIELARMGQQAIHVPVRPQKVMPSVAEIDVPARAEVENSSIQPLAKDVVGGCCHGPCSAPR